MSHPRVPNVMSGSQDKTAKIAAAPSRMMPPQRTVPHDRDNTNVMLNRHRELAVGATPVPTDPDYFCPTCVQRRDPKGQCLCSIQSRAK